MVEIRLTEDQLKSLDESNGNAVLVDATGRAVGVRLSSVLRSGDR